MSALVPIYYPDTTPPTPLPSTHLFPPILKATILPPSPRTSPPLTSSDSTLRSPSCALNTLQLSEDESKVDGEAQRNGPVSDGEGQERDIAGREDGWIDGRLECFERMTGPTWDQDVRFVEISTDSGLIYTPGSILQLVPSNLTSTIDQFLALQPHLPSPTTLLSFQPTQPTKSSPTPAAPISENSFPLPLTLQELLRDHLDLTAVPRRSFFHWLRLFATDEREQERLDEFLDLIEGGDDLYDYAHQPRRTILEVLSDFRNVRIPLDYLPEVFGRIRRREFSIASSSLVRHASRVSIVFFFS